MADEDRKPVDLEFPENFHRMKRTSLVFSTLLLLSYVPGVKPAESPLLSPFRDVNPDLLRSFIAIAAGYYLFAFVLEYLAARRLNRDLLTLGDLQHLHQFADASRLKLEGVKDWDPQEAEDAAVTIQQMGKMVHAIAEADVAHAKRRLGVTASNESSQLMREERISGDAADLKTLWSEYVQITSQAAGRLWAIRTTLDWLKTQLQAQLDSLSDISGRVVRVRRFQLDIWELGGVCVAFAAAAVCFLSLTVWPLADGLLASAVSFWRWPGS